MKAIGIDKNEVINFVRLDPISEIQTIKKSLELFKKKHNNSFKEFEDENDSYHWQEKDEALNAGRDNVPHQRVKTFPHCKRLFEGTMVESYEIVQEEELKGIETKLGVNQ
ncbi:MAG: hypothetical protein HRU72_10330 [Planctomycetia bacterium]|nr:hypothetical protein [Candidatus Brocadia sp.]QOJ06912.1 MAG: hypothetical protein HRU72_10330 [Planctomycetia bacterium]TVL95779.1 MAG: hypothetical protein CV082_09630 [Candidatus Brocadia sp. BL1]HQU30596.1 DUF6516 family protein [Candidatus Brocadia sapporoensis]